MIYVSYFAKMSRMPIDMRKNCVSIALWTPKGVNIPTYGKLAPSKSILLEYKNSKDEQKKKIYVHRYCQEVLKNLCCDEVAADLDGKVLCCYEKNGDFCHRYIVARWLLKHGYEVKEF